MTNSEYQETYKKAVLLGFDPLNDPVGKYLANECTVWCGLFEICFALLFFTTEESVFFTIASITGSIFMILYLMSVVKVAEYSRTGTGAILLTSLLMSPFSFPFAIAIKLGLAKK